MRHEAIPGVSHFEVRRATHQDLEEVYEIEMSSFDDPFPFVFFERMLKTLPRTFLVVGHQGSVVGYVIASIEGGTGHILSIAVDPTNRRRGIGLVLINELSRTLIAMNVYQLQLEVRRSNIIGQAFYENLGFVETGLVKGYYGNGEDAIVMFRELDRINNANHTDRAKF